MQTMEIVKEIMKIKDVKPFVLADRLNIKHSTFSERFKQKNITINKLSEMLRMLDYKIVLVPRESRIPEGGFEIE